MQLLNKRKVRVFIVLMFIFSLCMTACSNQKNKRDSSTEGETKVIKVTESEKTKPNLELVEEIELGNVSENKIPDVTAEKWSFGIESTKPIVSPDGKYVLIIEEEKMVWYDIENKKKEWEVATYGDINDYIVKNDRIYMSEKYSYKKEKSEGNIICIDTNDGKEIWKYNIQDVLGPVVKKYMPKDAQIGIFCNIHMIGHEDKLYALGNTSWETEENKDKCEILICLDEEGQQIWQTEEHGYPGIISMSRMAVVDGKLITGNYSYNDEIYGPASARAFDIKTGKEVWRYDIPHDSEMAYNDATNVAIGAVGDKVIAIASYGKVYILDSNGKKVNEFNAFEPEKHEDIVLCTNVYNSSTEFGENEIIVTPTKTVVKGTSSYNNEVPAQHSDVGMIKVFDLDGKLKWKFRIGGSVSGTFIKGNNMILSTSHNQDTNNYDYCGVYVFDISKDGQGKELDIDDKDIVEKYIGYYKTDGAIIYSSMGVSDDGKIVCAITWPTRVKTEKHGKHSMYIMKIE